MMTTNSGHLKPGAVAALFLAGLAIGAAANDQLDRATSPEPQLEAQVAPHLVNPHLVRGDEQHQPDAWADPALTFEGEHPPPEWALVIHDLIQAVQRAEYAFRDYDALVEDLQAELVIAQEKIDDLEAELAECCP